jgi:hypothetical protein
MRQRHRHNGMEQRQAEKEGQSPGKRGRDPGPSHSDFHELLGPYPSPKEGEVAAPSTLDPMGNTCVLPRYLLCLQADSSAFCPSVATTLMIMVTELPKLVFLHLHHT